MPNVAVLGTSTSWLPRLATDPIHAFTEPLEIRPLDIDPGASETCAEWGAAANGHWGRRDSYVVHEEQRVAEELLAAKKAAVAQCRWRMEGGRHCLDVRRTIRLAGHGRSD